MAISILEGNVLIDQEGRQIRADQIKIDKTQTYANASGRVQMAQSGLISQSDSIDYNLKTQQGDLNNSFFYRRRATCTWSRRKKSHALQQIHLN